MFSCMGLKERQIHKNELNNLQGAAQGRTKIDCRIYKKNSVVIYYLFPTTKIINLTYVSVYSNKI